MLCMMLVISLMQEAAYDATTPRADSVDMFSHIDRNTIRQCMAYNREFRFKLTESIQLHPHNHIATIVMSDAKAIYEAWDALDDASHAGHSEAFRRHALRRLRNAIGDHAFDHGAMPFPVPEWSLVAIR